MGFNRRKMEARRAAAAEKKAAAQRATEAQILEDAGRLVAAWNERQAKRMPMLFSPTIGCALKARHWFLWVRCPACYTTQSIDLRTVDRHPFAALTSLIPALSCRSCRPYARSPNSSASPTKASPTNYTTRTRAGRWANDRRMRDSTPTLRHSTGNKLANDGHDTRALQHYMGHKNIMHTVRYTDMAPDRFKNFWKD
jgi:hypothetical protein